LRNAARRGGVLSAAVRPVQQRAPAAREAQLLVLALDNSSARMNGAATDRTAAVFSRNRRAKWNLRAGGMVTCRPAADVGGALRSPLLSELWIDVPPLRFVGRAGGQGPRPLHALPPRGYAQAEPSPPFQLEVTGAHIVQPPDTQRRQATRINHVAD
jgi:hypothetical protein